jgi:SHS family sialic acid transporter-like MFS transporter
MGLDGGTGVSRRGQWLAVTAAGLGWMFDGFEMGLFPLAARPALTELLAGPVAAGLPDGASPEQVKAALEVAVGGWYAVVTAMFLFGAAAGGAVFGWLGDCIGRSRALLLSVLTYSVVTGLGGFATAAWQLAVLRFVAALGMGGEWSLGVALVMEVWPSKARPYLAGVIGMAANLGYLLVGVVSLGIDAVITNSGSSWRPLMFVGVAPAMLCLLIRLFVPESDKWKAAVAEGPKPTPLDLLRPELRGRTFLAIAVIGVALLGTWGSVQWLAPWTSKFVERAQLAQGVAPDEARAVAKTASTYAQMASAFGACVGAMAASLLAWQFGRRIVYFFLCLASLGVTAWLFRTPWEFGAIFLAVSFLVGGVTATFYGWAPLYLPELFPTRIRATGQGVAFNFGRIFAGIGTLVLTGQMAQRFQADLASSLATTSLIYAVGLVLIWFAPETKGQPLPD